MMISQRASSFTDKAQDIIVGCTCYSPESIKLPMSCIYDMVLSNPLTYPANKQTFLMYPSNSAVLLTSGIETVALNFKTGNVSLDQDLCPLLGHCPPASFPGRQLWPCPLPDAALFTIFPCLCPLQLPWSIWEDQDDPSTWHISPSCLLWLTPLYSSDLSLHISLSGKYPWPSLG